MRTLLLASLCLGLLAARGPLSADEPHGHDGKDESAHVHRVDDLIQKAGFSEDAPGVGILVVTNAGTLVKKSYGLANLEKHEALTTSTTFELASVSKQMCGSAVLLLLQRGQLHLDDDIRKHLPELPAYDAQHPITIDHLSRHLSGLPDYLSFEPAGDPDPKHPYATNADVLAEFGKRKDSSPLVSRPGAVSEYSNSGYMVLGCLVERLGGMSFGAFLAKEFFVPLGMTTAWVHESPKPPAAKTAVGYTKDGDAWKATWAAPTPEKHEKLFVTGDGSVWASLDDLEAWEHGLRTGNPVKTETIAASLALGKLTNGERVPYAMGWNVHYGDHDEPTSAEHSGKWGGFENYYLRDLSHGVTVVVLCNRAGFDSAELAHALAALCRE